MEDTARIGIASEKQWDLIDRKVSVAPMMDWTDDLNCAFYINSLGLPENACHLYGTTNFGSQKRLARDNVQRTCASP